MRRAALGFLGIGPFLLVAALLSGGRVAASLLAVLTAAFPLALFLLAGPPRGARRWFGFSLLCLAALLVGGGLVIVLLPPGAGPVGGLPIGTWVLLGALGILPFVGTSILFALAADGSSDRTARVPEKGGAGPRGRSG